MRRNLVSESQEREKIGPKFRWLWRLLEANAYGNLRGLITRLSNELHRSSLTPETILQRDVDLSYSIMPCTLSAYKERTL